MGAFLGRYKWIWLVLSLMLTATVGLIMGKSKEKDYLAGLYERRDFTLLDDAGDFFSISKLPERTLALLVFTPDGIPVNAVRPFYEFGRHVDDLRKMGIETMLVSRTNREVVKNFKAAARFPARLLLDTGGTVGRNTGIWEGFEAAPYWGYALVNNRNEVLWLERSEGVMSFEALKKTLNENR